MNIMFDNYDDNYFYKQMTTDTTLYNPGKEGSNVVYVSSPLKRIARSLRETGTDTEKPCSDLRDS